MGVGGRAARDCEPPVPILSSKHGQQGSQGGHCPPHSQEAGRAPSGDQGLSSSGVRPGLWVANSCLSPWTWRYRGPVFARHSAQRHPTHQTGVGTVAPPHQMSQIPTPDSGAERKEWPVSVVGGAGRVRCPHGGHSLPTRPPLPQA